MNEQNTLDRLHTLTNQLQERLSEAEDIRVRYVKAHDANNWPDLRSTSQSFTDEPEHDDSRTD
jgi:hypothetical protein